MKSFEITLPPGDERDLDLVKLEIARKYKVKLPDLDGLEIIKRSLDARKTPVYHLRCLITDSSKRTSLFQKNDVSRAATVHIVGAGPAGLFAALRLIELGLKPVIIERGKNVRERRMDLAQLMKKGKLNLDSNYCFGEGGAGTFSDGKLYTRSKKRGSIRKIIDLLIHFGANPDIAIDAHPHIGSNKLPQIISRISDEIRDCGGEINFSTRLTQFNCDHKSLSGVETSRGDFEVKKLVLASGHSASDIFYALARANIELEAKSFALGVRIEHPQQIINEIQYRSHANSPALPPAAYSFVTQVEDSGVYTFCMCPGGIICPASTSENGLVVNGWSPSTRGSKFANSGLVVEVRKELLSSSIASDPFSCLNFQSAIEEKAYQLGGGHFQAPAQRALDFLSSKQSSSLPDTSYSRGTTSVDLRDLLPEFISSRLKTALSQFVKQSPMYGHPDAVLVGVESRTSSPIRIPRNSEGEHPEVTGLYPCGEGAGYAGGIISSALDGVRIAESIARSQTAGR